jgi:signal transduction histidine kinase
VGGAITVESDGQGGATFRLRLPRAEAGAVLRAAEAQG